MRISHKALKMKSSSLLTDGALARWEASLKLGPGLRAHFGIQESGVAGVQELENLGAWRGFSQGDAGPGFSDKDLARVFCNSCNS
jgi:hypothetical protein